MRASRLLIGGLLFCGTIVAADAWIGIWKVRSVPQSTVTARTLTINEVGGNMYHVTIDDVLKSGENRHQEQTEICDGKEHLSDASGEVEICNQVDPLSQEVTIKVNGKVMTQLTRSISPDGKVLTVNRGGAVTTYDKQ